MCRLAISLTSSAGLFVAVAVAFVIAITGAP